MEIRFIKAAQRELDETIEYYNYELAGLGEKFLDEIEAALVRIKDFPVAWSAGSERTRRYRVRRFPYGLVYLVREREILIIAVANLHRRPDYWRSRL
jgi:mRNA-degrading endonuclease RelE of RelBE toxin-antitoxin system